MNFFQLLEFVKSSNFLRISNTTFTISIGEGFFVLSNYFREVFVALRGLFLAVWAFCGIFMAFYVVFFCENVLFWEFLYLFWNFNFLGIFLAFWKNWEFFVTFYDFREFLWHFVVLGILKEFIERRVQNSLNSIRLYFIFIPSGLCVKSLRMYYTNTFS